MISECLMPSIRKEAIRYGCKIKLNLLLRDQSNNPDLLRLVNNLLDNHRKVYLEKKRAYKNSRKLLQHLRDG